MTPPLYHAVDGDEYKLRDGAGKPLLLRKLSTHPTLCCNQWPCAPVGDSARIKRTLWFKETTLREVKQSDL